ncbi:amidohydrolase family protein [Nocardia salmonicida]|uniref:amidohydrolase family protein n=1 Tax=Nocardia salmonicida TaxID=53431 RepID=UPI00367859F9
MNATISGQRHVIDPHIHQWDPFTTPRHATTMARLTRPIPRIPALAAHLASRADREFLGDPHHALKPYLPNTYLCDTGEVSVSSVVHVEAAWVGADPLASVDETRWVAALPFGRGGAPALGAIVVHTDPRWPNADAILDAHLAASPLVRGVRQSAAHHPDRGVRDFADTPDLLSDPLFLDGFAAIAERGLTFELWLYAHQLPTAQRLVRSYPETVFVLDHYATPVGLFGPRGYHTGRTGWEPAEMLARWRDDLAELAEYPNVVAKHSGLGMPLLGGVPRHPYGITTAAELTDRAAPLIQHLHDCFGTNRTMWASNYPMDKPGITIPASAHLLLEVLGSDADPQQLFHDIAARTYRITTAARQPQSSPA